MNQEGWEKKVIESMNDIAMVADQNGKILYINHVLPGFNLESVIGSSIDNYIPPGYHEAYKEALKNVFESAKNTEFVVTGAGPNNTTSWYLTRIGPIKNGEQVEGAAIISTDITQRMLVDEDLKAAKKEVDRLQILLNQKDQQ